MPSPSPHNMITDLDRFIGEECAMLRATSDVTVNSLAKSLDISPTELIAYETGYKRMPASIMCTIAVILQIDLEHFIEGWDWSV